ncbi:hypothetical protein Val02_12530 [Virgisporangium aliadipatigenens]|uniref:WD40 repeat domain-containing protein n=1 Tax=Virgisporangium aliadipatigenens TaxID=741659 RepID=A0A8J4DPE5_9ACTN|nr:hypothetical protein [Virgisporangium aliadipatigenens]GIJ44367.1 hypothetical protein Val02_12530 [Virgisporangium aliadipatigenens]
MGVDLWGRPLRTELGGDVTALAFAPDGATLAVADTTHDVQLWDVAAGRRAGRPLTGLDAGVGRLAWSGDGRLLAASVWWDGEIEVWDVAAGVSTGRRPAAPLRERWPAGGELMCPVEAMAFDAGGALRVALQPTPDYGTLEDEDDPFTRPPEDELWLGDWYGGDAFEVLRPAGEVAAFGTGGRLLAARDPEGGMRLWDTAARQTLARWADEPLRNLTAVALAPDGRVAACRSSGGGVLLWEPLRFETPGPAHAAAFSPDGALLALGCPGGVVGLLDTATGRAVGAPLAVPTRGAPCVAFSPDGRFLAAGGSAVVPLYPDEPPAGGDAVVLWTLPPAGDR